MMPSSEGTVPWSVVALGIGGLLGVTTFLMTTLIRRPQRTTARIALSLGWVWAAGVVGLTFGTASGGGQALNLALLDVTNGADVTDFLLNVVMFLPAGILLGLLRVPWRRAVLFGLVASASIEVTQFVLSTGRTTDINDLASNALGCALGFSLIVGLRRLSASPTE